MCKWKFWKFSHKTTTPHDLVFQAYAPLGGLIGRRHDLPAFIERSHVELHFGHEDAHFRTVTAVEVRLPVHAESNDQRIRNPRILWMGLRSIFQIFFDMATPAKINTGNIFVTASFEMEIRV